MFISIGIDEDGRPYITTSDGSREKVVRKGKGSQPEVRMHPIPSGE